MINILLFILAISLCINAYFINNKITMTRIVTRFPNGEDLQKRNNEVCEFRKKVLIELGTDLYSDLPSYYTMMQDDKELKLENYFKGKNLEEAKQRWS